MTKTCNPSKSFCADINFSKLSIIEMVSGNRPGPTSLPVKRPTSGSITSKPRLRRISTFAFVAGSSHICGCIAGTTKTGASTARTKLVNRSSARPDAIRAIRSAVAGAIIKASADEAKEICLTSSTRSQTCVVTGRPDSASHVAAPTKFRLDGVGTTVIA